MKSQIGLIGVGVMGENLVLNMESKGFSVSVFDISKEKVEKFVTGRGREKNI
ncbi:MAG: NAD(P)-binding domain-containing protein, partial [Ignavibacteria bacterium]|nr:NAD(P)-binding domain-containing protein [Ignavibacteria bacterium]